MASGSFGAFLYYNMCQVARRRNEFLKYTIMAESGHRQA